SPPNRGNYVAKNHTPRQNSTRRLLTSVQLSPFAAAVPGLVLHAAIWANRRRGPPHAPRREWSAGVDPRRMRDVHVRGLADDAREALGQESLHHVSVDVGETAVQAIVVIRKLRVVEAQQMQRRRVEIPNRDGLDGRPPAEVVGGADHGSA